MLTYMIVYDKVTAAQADDREAKFKAIGAIKVERKQNPDGVTFTLSITMPDDDE
jgi:hypothetical protein